MAAPISLAAEREARTVRACLTCANRIGMTAFPQRWYCGVHGATCWSERYDNDDPERSCGVEGRWWQPRPAAPWWQFWRR